MHIHMYVHFSNKHTQTIIFHKNFAPFTSHFFPLFGFYPIRVHMYSYMYVCFFVRTTNQEESHIKKKIKENNKKKSVQKQSQWSLFVIKSQKNISIKKKKVEKLRLLHFHSKIVLKIVSFYPLLLYKLNKLNFIHFSYTQKAKSKKTNSPYRSKFILHQPKIN